MHGKTKPLLDRAHDDHMTMLLPGVADGVFGQHAQAAVEKYFKALINEHGVAYAYTHDLNVLKAALADLGENVPVVAVSLDDLTDYALELRYEDIGAFPTIDRKDCITAVETIRDYVELRIKQINS